MNNNDFFSEEYRRNIEALNNVVKNLSPQVEKIQQMNAALLQGWKAKFNPETLKEISALGKQMKEFSVLSEQLKESFTSFQLNEELQQFVEETKASENLSENEFETRYGRELKISKELGAEGWIVSGHATPKEIHEWHEAIAGGNHNVVIDFFEKDDGQVLKNICHDLEGKYEANPYKRYFYNGMNFFQEEDYITAAMYLVALLDVRVTKLAHFPEGIKYYSQKFSDKGFAEMKQQKFENSKTFFTKRYYFLNVYPSMITYLNRLFVDGKYKFEDKIEPPYINRNWLLHGRSSREIERFECIQVLNALDMIENTLGE